MMGKYIFFVEDLLYLCLHILMPQTFSSHRYAFGQKCISFSRAERPLEREKCRRATRRSSAIKSEPELPHLTNQGHAVL